MRRLLPLLLVPVLVFPAGAFGARAWQPPVKLSGAADADYASADVGSDGRVAAAWAEGSSDSRQLWLTVRPGLDPTMIDAAGSRAAVAVAGTGEAIVAWERRPADSGLPRAMAAIWSPSTGLGTPVDLGASGWARPIAVDADATGAMVVAFVREVDYAARLYTAYRPAGGVLGTPVEVTTSGSVMSADVALGAGGNTVFAWSAQTSGNDMELWGAGRTGAGPVVGAQKLSAAGTSGVGPSAAADGAGRGIVAWSEHPAGRYDGWLRAAVRSPAGTWTPATGLDGYTDAAPAVGADSDGDVLLTWAHFTPHDGGGGQGGPLRVASGRLDTATFQPGANVYPLQYPFYGPRLDVTPAGSAIVAWEDFQSNEVRTVRRAGTGAFGDPQTVKCPGPAGGVFGVGLDSAGKASVLFKRYDVAPAVRPLWLVQDAEADQSSPAACPPGTRKSYPLYDPISPAPGQEVLIDVEGTRDPDALGTTWSWDLDNDGTFERHTGTTPTTRYTWPTEGRHTWKLAAHVQFGQGGGGTSIWDFQISVMKPYVWPGPPIPTPQPAPKPTTAPDTTVIVTSGQRLRRAVDRGVKVKVTASTAGDVSAELWADAKEAKRLKLGRKATRVGKKRLALEVGKTASGTITFTKKARSRLRKARKASLGLAIVRGTAVVAIVPVTLK